MPIKPRPANEYGSVKVHPLIPSPYVGYFVQLKKLGYGKNRTEVAAYLIQRSVDDLIRAGVLKEKHIKLKDREPI